MGDKSSIEWTEATWNPTTGCTKVSAGCKFCYAERMSKRLAGRGGYPADEPFRLTLHPDRLALPLRWKRPRRVFVDSMSDLFHEDVPDEYICAVFGAMAAAPRHTFQCLTKRAKRMAAWFGSVDRRATALLRVFPDETLNWRRRHLFRAAYLRQTGDGSIPSIGDEDPAWPLPNVWLGTSVEDQDAADTRIPHLLHCPAVVRFLSCEPLLGPVSLTPLVIPDPVVTEFLRSLTGWATSLNAQYGPSERELHWVIAGGESGPGARPCDEDWLRSLRDQCSYASIPFFLKQLGGHPHKRGHEEAVLDGRPWKEWPATEESVR